MELFLNILKTFCFEVSLNNQGIAGQTVNILIQRKVDGEYWTGGGWTGTLTELAMTEKDGTNYPGIYIFDFTPTTADQYTVTYRIDGGTYQCNSTEIWNCATSNSVSLADSLSALLAAQTLIRQLLGNEQVTVQITGETYLITYDDSGIAGNAPVSSLKLRTFADAVIGDLTSTTAPMRRLKVL